MRVHDVTLTLRAGMATWPGEDPLGKRLFEVHGGRCGQGCPRGEVVGVVDPVRYEPLEADPWAAADEIVDAVRRTK